jgi:succinyl-CoA synthetase beta subunit
VAPLQDADVLSRIAAARAAGRHTLTECEAKALLAGLGVAVPRGGVARSENEAVELARWLDAPVVLKVVAPGLVHKSEFGGVVLPVFPGTVGDAYCRLLERVGVRGLSAPVEGVLVEEYVQDGVECVLSFTRASPFGPVVMFGLGGVFVEAMGDVSFRLAPLRPDEAAELLVEVRGARCLDGFRGRPAVDRGALVKAILALASLGDAPALEEVREVEIDPLLARPNGAVALDAVVMLR